MSDQVDEEYKSTFSVSWIKRFFSRIAFNILGTFWEFLIPIIQYSSLLVLMMIFSVVGYYLLNSALLPEALMSEPLYFDFSQTAPIAKLNMLSREKQWKYTAECMSVNRKQFVRGRENLSTTSNPQTPEEIDAMRSRMMDALRADSMRCSGLSRKRFLKAGFRYTIDVMFGLASSPKNLVLGKFMVHTKVIDSAGDTVATSSRPVAVPYQSHATLLLDAVVKYPLRAVGILPTSEVTDVVVPVMNEFREPFEMVTASTMSGNTLTTEYLELKLSSADVDIDYAFVTVMPLLSGITWCMYYYPYVSCVTGVFLAFVLQFVLAFGMFIVRYVGLVLISDEDDDEEDEEEEEVVESSQTVRQRQVSILPPISPPSAVLHVVTSSHRSDVDGRSRAHVRSPVGNYESDRIMGSSGRSRGGSSSERPSSETRRRNNESADRDRGSSGERSVSQREGELRRRIKRPIRSPPSSLI